MKANVNVHRLNKLHRIEYPNAEHVLISIDVLRRYAKGSSPLVGIPVVTDGSRSAAIFERHILQTALAAPGHIKAEYERHKAKLYECYSRSTFDCNSSRNELNKFAVLTINGGKACYRLLDQSCRYNHSEMKKTLTDWAENRRKALANQKERKQHGGAAFKKINDTRKQIVKLEKELSKVYVRRPVNPIVAEPREIGNDDYYRSRFADYAAEKPIRKALSKFIAGGVKTGTWAEFNQKLEAIVGHSITPFSTLTHRKSGPGWFDYWQALPKYTGMTQNPADRYDWPSREFNLERVKEARLEYANAVRLKRELVRNILTLKASLAEMEAR